MTAPKTTAAPSSRPAAAAPVLPQLHDSLLGLPLSTLLERGVVALTAQASIRDAARRMRDAGVSSLLITAEPEAQGELLGLITDRDLRNKVVAEGLDGGAPVLSIATRKVLTLPAQAPVFDAMLLLARHGIHHLPVVDGTRLLGVLSANRINERHSNSPLALAARIHRQDSVQALAAVASEVGPMQRQLAAAGMSAYNTGHLLTAITDAFTVRLIELAQARLGPAPLPWVWVAAGSQARAEQTARTDQDNCMVLDDGFDEARHGAYFSALAHFVCDGLAACGYVHCPGGMMAMTDEWRQPQRVWLQRFADWVQRPQPKALMLTCVFFDLRAVHGAAPLLDDLRSRVLQDTRGNSIFLAYMTSNALGHAPPLGLFGRMSTHRGGEHRGTIDLKANGVVPIVDLARVYALAAGVAAVNTRDRLLAMADGGEISADGSRDLREALEFLAALRIRHQTRQMAAGIAPDNHLRPDSLSSFERGQLKQAFSVVQTLQSVMAQRYTAGRF